MMQNVKLQLSNIRYNAAEQRYQAKAVVRGAATLTLTCAVVSPRDADLKHVVKQLSSAAMRAYKASQPKPTLPLMPGQIHAADHRPTPNRLH